jgi:hypothetical protein
MIAAAPARRFLHRSIPVFLILLAWNPLEVQAQTGDWMDVENLPRGMPVSV